MKGCERTKKPSYAITDLPETIDELLGLLYEKHPTLTDDQHDKRIITAVHEAGHFLIGLACNTVRNRVWIGHALVCASRKPPPEVFRTGLSGKVGEGVVQVDSYDPVDNVLITLGGAHGEDIMMSHPEDHLRKTYGCSRDIDEAKSMYENIQGVDNLPSFEHLVRVTQDYLETHIELVQIVAAAFLCWSDSKGLISVKKIDMLIQQLEHHKDFSRLKEEVVYGN